MGCRYFNFRSTKYLVNEGIYNFLNWFDSGSWYPLGRIVGGTVYPGMDSFASCKFVVFTVDCRIDGHRCSCLLGLELL